jgi:hypothetical protein
MTVPSDAECQMWQKRADDWVKYAVPASPDNLSGRGIVISAGGAKYFICAWVCVKMLRLLGCQLPIQFWILGDYELDARMRKLAEELGVSIAVGQDYVRQIPTWKWDRERPGWQLKALSLVGNPFSEVLLLDGDNVPTVDPGFLFDTPEFKTTGAVFWPDYLRLKKARVIWKLCGVEYRDEPEFETGQIVVDKKRCWLQLWLSLFYNQHSDLYYQHIWGDKDTFHMAWRRLGTPYSMTPFPIHNLARKVMCQHDFGGRIVFQHRNLAKWELPVARNKRIGGFQYEQQCIDFLKELEAKWTGAVLPKAPKSQLEQTAASELTTARTFLYHRVGYDKRYLEFLPTQEIGQGRAEREQTWTVEDRSGEVILTVLGNGKPTFQARRHERGIWLGSWLVGERMPIELIPAPLQVRTEVPATPTTSRWEDLIKRRHIYILVNHTKRLIELRQDGTIGLGSGPYERRWELVEPHGKSAYILLHGDKDATCQLTPGEDGVWRGRLLVGERTAVNLVPIPDEPD